MEIDSKRKLIMNQYNIGNREIVVPDHIIKAAYASMENYEEYTRAIRVDDIEEKNMSKSEDLTLSDMHVFSVIFVILYILIASVYFSIRYVINADGFSLNIIDHLLYLISGSLLIYLSYGFNLIISRRKA